MKFIRLLLFFCLTVLCGCASLVQKSQYSPDPSSLARALGGDLILGHSYKDEELPEIDLFSLTPAMKAFADQIAMREPRSRRRAELLHQQLILPQTAGGRGLTYSARTTITGAEAFQQAKANCLSYTLLYVELARYLDLDARYNEVILPPSWSMRDNDTFIFMRHVNARVVFSHALWGAWGRDMGRVDQRDIVVDLEMRRYREDYTQYPISRTAIAAQFYSNRALDLVAKGDARQSFLHLRKALLLAGDLSYLWSNIGSLYQRQQMMPEAEALYLKGLSYNPKDLTIMHNLASLYEDMGDQARAQFFAVQVSDHRKANPYFLYMRAQEQLAQGDLDEAARRIEAAIKKLPQEALFYEFALDIYTKLGNSKKIKQMRRKLDDHQRSAS